MRLVRDGSADAVVSAGNTGAGVASAILNLRRLPGVDRPALAVQMTTAKGPFVLLDIGATTDSTGHNLAQYARMGSLYAERVLGVDRPSVALLSIGEEAGKGEQRVQEATERLAGSDLNFIGNVEGRHLVEHVADVVVCDAAVGNVTIKFFEGLSSYILRGLLRREFERDWRGRLAYLLLRPGIARIREVFDYEKLGGSPLLGVRGTVLITHGRARRRMISYAVAVGAAAARAGIPKAIEDAFRSEPPAVAAGEADASEVNGDEADRAVDVAADGASEGAAPRPAETTR
jgi:glycerol-3-phosphate acyltransferase PlsX